MARATNAPASRRRRKKRLKLAKGYFGGRHRLFRSATETVKRAQAYSWRDRKVKKRIFRNIWVIRINAAVRPEGLTYSKFMSGLKKANIEIDRKILALLALDHPKVFAELIKAVKAGIK
jgi:large subunit ribosomal protein L20